MRTRASARERIARAGVSQRRARPLALSLLAGQRNRRVDRRGRQLPSLRHQPGLHALSSSASEILRSSRFMDDQPSELPVILSERDEGDDVRACERRLRSRSLRTSNERGGAQSFPGSLARHCVRAQCSPSAVGRRARHRLVLGHHRRGTSRGTSVSESELI